ncbi:hypothetical protein BGZ93_009189 [Podila epicladia]|nr:hypothetical protein BGZ93_009189 [Podila epicladia]
MTFTLIKTIATLLSFTCTIQAVPLGCAGSACYQSASSGNVKVGSATNLFPVTNVTPLTRYQPIVQSECSHGRGSPLGSSMLDLGSLHQPLFTKRHMSSEKHLRPDCIPSAADSCELALDSVTAAPSNVILPSTVYQGRVQSQAPEVFASPAEHSRLGSSNVELGGSALIQPVTHVAPSTVYQPSVENKSTIIESETGEHQSLAGSSVDLGSQTTIRPTTYVEPLTVIRPRIKTLTATVSELGCDAGGSVSGGIAGLQGIPSFAAGFPLDGLGRPGSALFMSPVSNVYEIEVADDDEKVKEKSC